MLNVALCMGKGKGRVLNNIKRIGHVECSAVYG